MDRNYDFSGWATRNDLKCSDGRTIRKDAFKHNDGQTVPLVWNHQHNDPLNVLGHALLENREEGVYAYCTMNDTPAGKHAREMVQHGDITALSIYANHLKQDKGNVLHGSIRELSLVLAGANPGAFIDSVVMHGEENDEAAVIYTGEDLVLEHADKDDEEPKKEEPSEDEEPKKEEPSEDEESKKDDESEPRKELTDEQKEAMKKRFMEQAKKELKHAEAEPKKEEAKKDSDKTVKDVFDELTEEQKNVVYYMIGQAMEDAGKTNNEGDKEMKQNAFESNEVMEQDYIAHDEMEAILKDAKRYGSLKDACLAHGIEDIESDVLTHAHKSNPGAGVDYGITGYENLFPDAKSLNTPPEFIKRKTEWVSTVLGGVRHTPFTRIKSMWATLTADEARAKGYITENQKTEEVFPVLKRTTSPQTIYKKQKLDRDDILDITDFDVVAWLKNEMRMMLDEEIARAILIGDGRESNSADKINEENVRPIWLDVFNNAAGQHGNVFADAYELTIPDEGNQYKSFMDDIIRARKDYRGSGNPTLFCTEALLTEMLLIDDGLGRPLYPTEADLCKRLRVAGIVTVPVMEGQYRTAVEDGNTYKYSLQAILVNLKDYNVGCDKGGAVTMFEDFDIDYNQQKYLMETRISGALVVPHSAQIFETKTMQVQ